MYDHLGTWTAHYGDCGFRLDLWDTGKTDSYGKATLHYALAIMPDATERVVILEGSDFHPSPLQAIDSAETAGGLLSFFSAYGESIRYSGDDADVPEFTPRQRVALETYYQELGDWSYMLETDDDDAETDDDDAEPQPEEYDAYITDMRDGYSVAFNGRWIGTYPRWSRAAAALYLEMGREQYWPNVWDVNDHGNQTLYAFHGHRLEPTGTAYV